MRGAQKVPLISVIVPVYNVEKYLPKCVDSIMKQTLNDIEIILVDDGSTDFSGDLCDEFSREDNRICVIHKENGGASSARNAGIESAKGKYLMFVDGDDWVEPKFCEAPYIIAEKNNADTVAFGYKNVYSDGIVVNSEEYKEEGILSEEIKLERIKDDINIAVWNKIFRKELFNDLRFPEGFTCEDLAITHKCIYESDKVYLTNQYLYNYRRNRYGSAMNSLTLKYYSDWFILAQKRYDDLEVWGIDCSDDRVNLAINLIAKFHKETEISKECRRILDSADHLPDYCSRRKKCIFKLYKISPVLFDFLSVLLQKRV